MVTVALMRTLPLFALLLCLAGCGSTGPMAPDKLLGELETAEDGWLMAYARHDRAAMSRILSSDFRITFADGTAQTREDVIANLDRRPRRTAPEPMPHTEKRAIRILDNTAIVSGVYVNPGSDGQAERRSRYTDTWMRIQGRWRVVASHLSCAEG